MRYALTLMLLCSMTVSAHAYTWTLKGGDDPNLGGKITLDYTFHWGDVIVHFDGNPNGWPQVQRCGQDPYTTKFIIKGDDPGAANMIQLIQAFDPLAEDQLNITQGGAPDECVDSGQPGFDFVRVGTVRLYPGGITNQTHPIHWLSANHTGAMFGDTRVDANTCNTMEANGEFKLAIVMPKNPLLSTMLAYRDGDTLDVVLNGSACLGKYSQLDAVNWIPADPYTE